MCIVHYLQVALQSICTLGTTSGAMQNPFWKKAVTAKHNQDLKHSRSLGGLLSMRSPIYASNVVVSRGQSHHPACIPAIAAPMQKFLVLGLDWSA